MKTADFDVIIIGGGITGFATGLAFSKYGYKVKIFEKALAIHPVGAAIGLFPNGLSALKEISENAWAKVNENSIYVKKMVFKNLKSQVVRDVNTAEGNGVIPLYLVWYKLQHYLIEEIPEEQIGLAKQFVSYSLDEEDGLVHVTLLHRATGLHVVRTCKLLIGADGIHSTLRAQMLEKDVPRKYRGKLMFRAVFDINLVSDQCTRGTAINYAGDQEGKLFAFRETSPGIGTVTSMANYNEEDAVVIEDLTQRKKRWRALFSNYPKEVTDLIDTIAETALHEDRVETIDVLPVWSRKSVVLIGDACHCMSPGMGQGVNIGLEDAIELATLFKAHLPDLSTATLDQISDTLVKFTKLRLSRVREVHFVSEVASNAVKKTNHGTTPSSSSKDGSDNNAVSRLPGLSEDEKKAFYEKVYTWKPSTVEELQSFI